MCRAPTGSPARCVGDRCPARTVVLVPSRLPASRHGVAQERPRSRGVSRGLRHRRTSRAHDRVGLARSGADRRGAPLRVRCQRVHAVAAGERTVDRRRAMSSRCRSRLSVICSMRSAGPDRTARRALAVAAARSRRRRPWDFSIVRMANAVERSEGYTFLPQRADEQCVQRAPRSAMLPQPTPTLNSTSRRRARRLCAQTAVLWCGGSLKVTFVLPARNRRSGVGPRELQRLGSVRASVKKRSNGTRSVTVEVPAGNQFEFKYLAEGGEWFCDPDTDAVEVSEYSCTTHYCEPDENSARLRTR